MSSPALNRDELVAYVAESFGFTAADVFSNARPASLARTRHVIAFLLRRLFSLSFPEIARVMGYGDHTSAKSAYHKGASRYEADTLYAADVNRLIGEVTDTSTIVAFKVRDDIEFTSDEVAEISDVIANAMKGVVERTVERKIADLAASGKTDIAQIMSGQFGGDESAFAGAVADVVTASTLMENAKFTTGEKAARIKLEKALSTLRAIYTQTEYQIERIAS